jgi:monovalent cation:H+ antiporter-2, CPA2 family
MPAELHETSLIALLAVGFALALLFGLVASNLKISPIVGYLIAGICVGPFTPGFVGDSGLAGQLSEIGVILLMFGVGLHFSIKDLMSVRYIALPGAVAQIATATAIGVGMAHLLGWTFGQGLVFGLSLSVASTVVLLRALEERNALQSSDGKIAVGWLIVEDLAMVLALVMLPALAETLGGDAGTLSTPANTWLTLGLTLAKVAVFVALALVVGTRVVPWLLMRVTRTGSRELFTLCVLAIALGIAYGSAALFGVSFALGAFFAGMILSESTLSQRAAQETLPLRDAFAVLFFVSVGMLFNPGVIVSHPLALLATLLIVTVVKAGVAFGMMRLFRYPESTALMIAASRAQVGEFSFILAGLGVAIGLLPAVGRDLVLAAALISILFTPFLFAAADWIHAHHEPPKKPEPAAAPAEPQPSEVPTREAVPIAKLSDHVVLVGYGRVGSVVGVALTAAKVPLLVIENDQDIVESLHRQGIEAIVGNAADPELARAANYPAARCLLVAVPDGFEGGQIVEQARAINPTLPIIARSHSEEETAHLRRHGASKVTMGEHLIAHAMIEDARAAVAFSAASPVTTDAPPATAPTAAATAEPARPT